MRFFIKAAFWLTIVVLLIPAEKARDGQHAQVGALEALGAAQAAVEDASGFCKRNPDACETGSQAFQTFGEKAQYGAKLLYEFLAARFSDGPAPTATGSIKTPQKPGTHTLTPSDLEPAWSAPEPARTPIPPRRPV
jgi:hypothetical protein